MNDLIRATTNLLGDAGIHFEQALRDGMLDDLYQTEPVAMVMAGGRLFDAATMNQMGKHPQERALFYWEKDEVSDAFVWRGPGLGFMGPTCSCGQH